MSSEVPELGVAFDVRPTRSATLSLTPARPESTVWAEIVSTIVLR